MAASDLASLADVSAWLGGSQGAAADVQITRLITSVSRAIYSAMQRPSILPASFVETSLGSGATSMALRNYPVVSVASLSIGETLIVQSNQTMSSGWVIEDVDPAPPSRQSWISLRGYRFCDGVTISASYVAGYQVSQEAQIIPASSSMKVDADQPFGAWASDRGVSFSTSGVALVAVAASPAQGQYAVSDGVYTFNAADASKSVLLSYGFIPADLAQACIEWTASRFRAQSYIGVKSKSIGGQETVSYDTAAMPDYVSAIIQPYKRVTLC